MSSRWVWTSVQIVGRKYAVSYLIRTRGLLNLSSQSLFWHLSICRLAFWPYIKLMIVGYLVLPYFDGSLYVYKHLINPCLSMSPAIITCQFNKQEELFFKKDDFLVEMRRYMKEKGSDALEDLIASTVYMLLRSNKSMEIFWYLPEINWINLNLTFLSCA